MKAAGFTLLEILVALVVFGFLMLGLGQSVRYGMRAYTDQTRAAAAPAELAAADGALRRLIEQAVATGFVGRPDGFAFTTLLPASSGLEDPLADAAVLVVPGQGLVLRYTPHPAGVPLRAAPAVMVEPLFGGVRAIRVTYLTPQAAGPPAWSDHWRGDGVPLLVRIGFVFAGKAAWPDLVAAPVAAGG